LDVPSQIRLSISLYVFLINILCCSTLLTKIEAEHIFRPVEEITLKEILIITILIASNEFVNFFLEVLVFLKKLVVFLANRFGFVNYFSSCMTLKFLGLFPEFPLCGSHLDSSWMTVHVNTIEHAKMLAFDSQIQIELFDASPESLVPIENKHSELKEP